MPGNGQRSQPQAPGAPYWSAAESCYVYPNGARFNPYTQQWQQPPVQHQRYHNNNQQQQPQPQQQQLQPQPTQPDAPRTPPPQLESLAQAPSESTPSIWDQQSPSEPGAYNVSSRRRVSSSSGGSIPHVPRIQHVGQPGSSYPGLSNTQGTQQAPGGGTDVYSRHGGFPSANPSTRPGPTGVGIGGRADSSMFNQSVPVTYPGSLEQQPSSQVPYRPVLQGPIPSASREQPSQNSVHRFIQGTDDDYEQLDHRYKKRSKEFFKKFRVFMMLWSEPCNDKNSAGGHSTAVMTQKETLTKALAQSFSRDFVRDRRFGQPIYSKIRRLIVVQDRGDRCLCVPIVSYKGQGVAKKGVNKSEHAIAYTGKDAPKPQKDEKAKGNEKPMRTSIRVRADEPGDQLDSMSRIHYGRYYTVEKNIKARAFGVVHENSEKDLEYDFLNVFMGEERYKAWQEQHRRKPSRSGNEAIEEEEGEDDTSEEESEDDDSDGNDERGTSHHKTSLPAGKGKAPARDPRVVESQASVTTRSVAYSQMGTVPAVQTATGPVTQHYGVPSQLPYRTQAPSTTTYSQTAQRRIVPSNTRTQQEESEEDSTDEDSDGSEDQGRR